MKKILRNSFPLLMFVFLMLYLILLRYNATDSYKIYSIGLIIGAICMGVFPIVLNNCKKLQVRILYYIVMISLSVILIFYGISYLNYNNNFGTFIKWALHIFTAISISTFIFLLIYSIKDWFKKSYTLEKFDLQAIQMIVNSLTYGLVIYYLCFQNGPKYEVDAATLHQKSIFEFKPIALILLYISIGYLIVSFIIELIYYKKFIKNNPGN